jgi:hypothetical protein
VGWLIRATLLSDEARDEAQRVKFVPFGQLRGVAGTHQPRSQNVINEERMMAT